MEGSRLEKKLNVVSTIFSYANCVHTFLLFQEGKVIKILTMDVYNWKQFKNLLVYRASTLKLLTDSKLASSMIILSM